MKGAIGNAFILNMVITFIIIFFTLLIGSMAYTKAYKTKNYLLNEIDRFVSVNQNTIISRGAWDARVNEYLQKTGYAMNESDSYKNSCPSKENYKIYTEISSKKGRYDYCIYYNNKSKNEDTITEHSRTTFMVLVYMKLDLPVIGNFIKIPITGETKTYILGI